MLDRLLDDLKQQIADESVLAIVGAGVSMAATGNNAVASWKGLLLNGIDRCERFTKCPSGWATRVREQVDGDMIDLLCAAENICQRLGAPTHGDYSDWLEETVGALRVVDSSVLSELIALNVPIATTNYDSLIEEVTGLRCVTWCDRSRSESFVRRRSDGVLHLHGHWENPKSVVLGIRSYEDLLRDEHAQNLLRTLRTMRTLLFVGFGAGLRDPNFGALLKWAGRVFSESSFRHFRLCLDEDLSRTQGQHPAEERIIVLSFGDRYGDLAKFLRGLRSNGR